MTCWGPPLKDRIVQGKAEACGPPISKPRLLPSSQDVSWTPDACAHLIADIEKLQEI